MSTNKVAIIDFGSQTTQLIARRTRELKIYSEVFPCTVSVDTLKDFGAGALILSGGPASVKEDFAPKLPQGILDLGLPILGICYGMQVFSSEMGGDVDAAEHREFGRAEVSCVGQTSALFNNLKDTFEVWMSHGDQVHRLPKGFKTIAQSVTCPHAAVEYPAKHFYGVQFHPEVTHTPDGKQILSNFLFDIAGLSPSWEMSTFLKEKVEAIRKQVKDKKVMMGLSGGVDNSVPATLIHKAIGDQLTCIYVNHGLHRLGELEEIESLFQDQYHIQLRIVNAEDRFFKALAGITDPEQKRKTVGRIFIEVFEEEARALGDIQFLGQGTLYPDVVESVSAFGGPSAVIKSHHNVGGLPERMKLKLVEPLRELFKDEVRVLGKVLGLPQTLLGRQPFPGPGFGIRVVGEVTKERCGLLQKADAIVQSEINEAVLEGGMPKTLWQWFAILLPVKSVGVMGDGRTHGDTVVVRCVESSDGMTADWVDLPKALLGRISSRIINEVKGISRVLYDVSSKPPSTIEWE